MTDREVMAEIRRLLRDELEHPDPVGPADRLRDCPVLDSVGIVTLAVGLEDRFRIYLTEEDAPRLETFADLAALVERRRVEQHGPQEGAP